MPSSADFAKLLRKSLKVIEDTKVIDTKTYELLNKSLDFSSGCKSVLPPKSITPERKGPIPPIWMYNPEKSFKKPYGELKKMEHNSNKTIFFLGMCLCATLFVACIFVILNGGI